MKNFISCIFLLNKMFILEDSYQFSLKSVHNFDRPRAKQAKQSKVVKKRVKAEASIPIK